MSALLNQVSKSIIKTLFKFSKSKPLEIIWVPIIISTLLSSMCFKVFPKFSLSKLSEESLMTFADLKILFTSSNTFSKPTPTRINLSESHFIQFPSLSSFLPHWWQIKISLSLWYTKLASQFLHCLFIPHLEHKETGAYPLLLIRIRDCFFCFKLLFNSSSSLSDISFDLCFFMSITFILGSLTPWNLLLILTKEYFFSLQFLYVSNEGVADTKMILIFSILSFTTAISLAL